MSTLSSDPPPDQPSVTVSSTAATTISLSWSVPSGSVVDSYEVVWETDSSATIADGSITSYTITGLEEETNYTITVTATNAAGSAASEPVTGATLRAGNNVCVWDLHHTVTGKLISVQTLAVKGEGEGEAVLVQQLEV